jgi:type III pantothenate kinase
MQQLVLDIGNSRTKLGLFSGDRPIRWGHAPNGDVGAVRAFLAQAPVANIVVGSVARQDPALLEGLSAFGPVQVISGDSPSPLRSAYATPNTLGVDRSANAVGGVQLFPGRAVLVIDLGTCVTYDVVDAKGTFLGGVISPGLRMRAKAMNAYSARLPLVDPLEDAPLIGLSTAECLASGAHHGLRAELKTLIAEVGQQHPGLAVVLTGGDAPRFARALENGIFAHPFLTLLGLHALSLFAPSYPAAARPS